MSGVLGTEGSPPLNPVRVSGWLGLFLALTLVVGCLAGIVWFRVVDLPGYLVSADGGASTNERGLAEFFAGDAWFTALGVLVGLGLGTVAWRWFAELGWPVVFVAVVAAVIAALVCWYIGYRLGPGPFPQRLAAAQAGDFVPIELTVRARVSVVVWPFMASIPVLLASSLGPDDEEPRPLFKRRRS